MIRAVRTVPRVVPSLSTGSETATPLVHQRRGAATESRRLIASIRQRRVLLTTPMPVARTQLHCRALRPIRTTTPLERLFDVSFRDAGQLDPLRS